MGSVWSASDAAAAPGGMALSNGGLTVTPTTASWSSLRATTSQSSGKLYVEFKNGPADAVGAMMMGLGSSSMNIGTYLGNSSYSFGFYFAGGNIFINMGAGSTNNYGTSETPAAGDTWAMALDLTSGKVWLAERNVWFGGGNPATGANPAMTYVPANVAPLFPALAFNGANVSAWTLQPGAASQTYAPPSGFRAWDDVSAWTPADLGANLLVWLDASDVATVTVTGSGVSQWTDKSGNARHATQATDANRPVYVSGSSLTFISQKVLAIGGTPLPAYDFALAGITANNALHKTLLFSASNAIPFLINGTNNLCSSFTTGFLSAGALTWLANTAGLIYGTVSNSAFIQFARDGGSFVSESALLTSTTLVSIGRLDVLNQGFGSLNEVVLITKGSPLESKQKLEGYQAWKWGLQALLPSGHPYQSAAPLTVDLAGSLPV